MSLTGWPLLALVTVVALALPAGSVLRPALLGQLGTGLLAPLLIAGQAATVVVLGLAINDNLGFYPSWHDLLGQEVTLSASPLKPGSLDSTALRSLAHAPKGHGIQLNGVFEGASPSIKIHNVLYIPAEYLSGTATLRFPVVEISGAPTSGPGERRIVGALDVEIASRRLPPVIAVMSNLPRVSLIKQLMGELRIRTDGHAWAQLRLSSASRSDVARSLDGIGLQISGPLVPALAPGRPA